ncbi:hypothetical protein D3C76_1650520 [compost metagenome]
MPKAVLTGVFTQFVKKTGKPRFRNKLSCLRGGVASLDRFNQLFRCPRLLGYCREKPEVDVGVAGVDQHSALSQLREFADHSDQADARHP